MAFRGLSISELAKKSGIHYVQISGYLKSDAKGKYPSLKNLIALAMALNCSLEDLTGYKMREIPKTKTEDMPQEIIDLAQKIKDLPDNDWRRQAIDKILMDHLITEENREND